MIIKIQEDIYNYEHRVWGNFTARQLVFGGIAFVAIALTFIGLFWKIGDLNLSFFAAVMVGVPIFFCAIKKKDGQYMEKILYIRFFERFRFKQKRKFVMSNLYEILQNNQKEYEAYVDELKQQKDQEAQQGHCPRFLSLAKKRHLTK
jgi:hypothetical protein